MAFLRLREHTTARIGRRKKTRLERNLLPWVFLLAGAFILGSMSANAIAAGPSEYDVKAAFLYNFPKFIELPGDTTVTLCIIGDDPFEDAINALEGSMTAGKRLVVKRVSSVEAIPACQILFISSSEHNQLEPIMKYSRTKQMLTVGDTPGYVQQGVVINFYMENNKVKIEINVDAAEQRKLKISSRLLSLARIVHDRP